MTIGDRAGSLEVALAELEREADALVRALMSAVKEAKRVKAAAAVGALRDVQQAVDGATHLAAQAAALAGALHGDWRFDAQAYFASGEYTKELLASAADAGVQAVESDERVLCYPSILSVSSSDTTVIIDKKKERGTRPSVVVRHLAALQQRELKFNATVFLEMLAKAYDRVAPRPGAPVKLLELYGLLTLLPGSSKDYTKPEFARDLYLLDQSGHTTTKDGRQLRLPASALTRGSSVLTTVTKTGQVKVYAGITFDGGS